MWLRGSTEPWPTSCTTSLRSMCSTVWTKRIVRGSKHTDRGRNGPRPRPGSTRHRDPTHRHRAGHSDHNTSTPRRTRHPSRPCAAGWMLPSCGQRRASRSARTDPRLNSVATSLYERYVEQEASAQIREGQEPESMGHALLAGALVHGQPAVGAVDQPWLFAGDKADTIVVRSEQTLGGTGRKAPTGTKWCTWESDQVPGLTNTLIAAIGRSSPHHRAVPGKAAPATALACLHRAAIAARRFGACSASAIHPDPTRHDRERFPSVKLPSTARLAHGIPFEAQHVLLSIDLTIAGPPGPGQQPGGKKPWLV